MTKMTKRAFSLLLTLTLLITILPYNVWADEQQKSDSRQNENNVTLSYMVVDKPKIEKTIHKILLWATQLVAIYK